MKSPQKHDNPGEVTMELQKLLPETEITKEGCSYCPRDEMWHLRDAGNETLINYKLYQQYCTDKFIGSLKLVMVNILKTRSLDTCQNAFYSFRYLVVNVYKQQNNEKVDIITDSSVLHYIIEFARHDAYQFSEIKPFLLKWIKLGYYGVDPDVFKTLKEIKIKGPKRGVAVKNHDPVKGPYNREEFQAITQYLLDNFAECIIDLSDLSLGLLCMVFGARPISFASLRIKDFSDKKDEFGIHRFVLSIPAAKRRGGGRRTHLQDRKLTQEYGMVLSALVAKLKADFTEEITGGLDLRELPLFPKKNPGKEYDSSGSDLYRKMKACFAAGEPILCNRKGHEKELLRVNLKRFRHTVGTRMAEEGKREREIAEALGHVNLSSSRVYIEATGKIRHSINEKLALEVNPIARYFKGEVVYSEGDAIRGNDPSSRVRCFQGGLKGDVLGNCGKTGFCGGFVPLPCFSCRDFQPWISAPHEEVLKWLILDRQKKYEITGDEQYATINDEIIKKVADVAMRCRKHLENAKKKEIVYE